MSSPATFFRKYLWRSIACALPAVVLLHSAWLRQAEVMHWPSLTREPALEDPNIWTRLEQTRQWLAGENIERLWSRTMDILIGFFHSLTPDTWAEEIRLMVAAAWLPAVLGIIAFAFLARASLKRFNNWHVLFTLVFLLAVNPLTGYFTPGDVDRHSIVIAMWCGVLGLMLVPLTQRGAVAAGLMMGVMLWGDMESVLPVAVVFSFMGYLALRKRVLLRPLAAMAAAAVVTATAALAFEMRGGADISLLLAGGGFNEPQPVPTELKPLLSLEWSLILQHIWQPLLALALLLRLRRGRATDAALGAVLASCCFLMLAQVRFSYYAQVAAVLAIAPLLPVYAMQVARGLPRKLRPYTLLVACCAVVIAIAPPAGGTQAEQDKSACQAQMRYVIHTQQLQKLAGDKSRIIVAPADVAGDIIFFTPYNVIAGEYMREGSDMERLRAIVAETETAKARALLKLENADLLFFCPAQAPKGSWLAGKPPAWIVPVDGMAFTAKKQSLQPLFYTIK